MLTSLKCVCGHSGIPIATQDCPNPDCGVQRCAYCEVSKVKAKLHNLAEIGEDSSDMEEDSDR